MCHCTFARQRRMMQIRLFGWYVYSYKYDVTLFEFNIKKYSIWGVRNSKHVLEFEKIHSRRRINKVRNVTVPRSVLLLCHGKSCSRLSLKWSEDFRKISSYIFQSSLVTTGVACNFPAYLHVGTRAIQWHRCRKPFLTLLLGSQLSPRPLCVDSNDRIEISSERYGVISTFLFLENILRVNTRRKCRPSYTVESSKSEKIYLRPGAIFFRKKGKKTFTVL